MYFEQLRIFPSVNCVLLLLFRGYYYYYFLGETDKVEILCYRPGSFKTGKFANIPLASARRQILSKMASE